MTGLLVSLLALLVTQNCISKNLDPGGQIGIPPLDYRIDLNDRADDTFKVRLRVSDLGPENNVYQFAVTAPGTYQSMDIGRFVTDFATYDTDGKALRHSRVSVNQFQLMQPEKIAEIRYSIKETWDAAIGGMFIYPMAGTSIENDHVQITPHAVLGYPSGMQGRALELTLDYPSNWTVGTALDKSAKTTWAADSYDHAVDSPILLGELSFASKEVRGTKVEVFTYSKSGKAQSKVILEAMDALLVSVGDFLKEMPVNRYTFLFHFEDFSVGAWEHSYSSNYVYSELDYQNHQAGVLLEAAAHEIFHIITPLNIHSDLITPFDFVTPRPSQHLWLYEGITEWASDMLRFRGGMMQLEDLLLTISGKIGTTEQYDQDMSLVEISLNSYVSKGATQFGNIYELGALTAMMLDIRLLALSDGQRGLREVLLALSKRYGPQKAFPEEGFFSILVEMTDPQIGDFIERYIKDDEALPYAETFALLGIEYVSAIKGLDQERWLGVEFLPTATGQFLIKNPDPRSVAAGVRENDSVFAVEGRPVSWDSAQTSFGPLRQKRVGDSYTVTVIRDGKKHDVSLAVLNRQVMYRHVLRLMRDPSPQQNKLRTAWQKNL